MPPGGAKFPVLIFSPGGQAPVLIYQILLEELASRGYVVFGLEHGTDSALIIRPDRSMITYVNRRPSDSLPTVAYLQTVRDEAARRSVDIVFSLSRIALLARQPGSTFRGRIDLSRIGVFGHSAGGQAAVRACQLDGRLRACLNLDGEMFGVPLGSTEPVPTVLPRKPALAPVAVVYVAEPAPSDAQLAALGGTRAQYDDWRAAKSKALRAFLLQQPSRETYLITIALPGYVHATFMDPRLFGAAPNSEAALNHKNAADISRAFFDAQLSWGDRKSASGFEITPQEGVKVERLGIQR
jgi:dienelactone hydrolase